MSDTSKKPTKTPAATSPSSSSFSNSSASNQDSGTVRVIIGEIGRDTKTGVLGRGYSFDNGETFHVTDTIYGRLYGPKDGNAIWDVIHPKVKDTIDKQEELLQAASKSASDAVKQAEQAVTTSKVNSDAINAMRSATSSAKSDADTAMQQASSAVSAISAQIAEVEKSVADTNSANKSAIDALKGNISDAQQTISDVSKDLSTVSANLDTYAKSAAEQGHDITSLKNQQGKLEADMASVSGNVAQLTATTDKLQANIKDNSGNIASLQETASQTAVSIQNAQSQVASVIATANNLQAVISDQNKQITSIQQTASAASVSASDAKSNAVQAQLTASAATVLAGDAKADALSVSATASEAKLTATNASSQAMQANATASGVAVDLKSVEGNVKANSDKADSTAQQLSAVSQKVTTNEANISATQKQIEAKADQVTVDNLNKTVSSQAGEIQANANGLLLKADKTVTDSLNKSFQEQQAQQKVLADQITSKVSSADVEKLVDGKGFATKDLVESSITQASGKINETITNLQGNLQNITADLTGLQSTVKDKADQSQITQLTNVVQSKVSSKDYQTTISQLTNDINAKVAKGDLISQINMEAGQTLIQSKKLFLDADSVVFSGKAFIPDAAIANLSLDKLTTGHITIPLTDKFGNEIELGREGIEISSLYSSIDRKEPDSSANSDDSSVASSQTGKNAVQAASLMTSFAAIANQPDGNGGTTNTNNGGIPDQPDNPDHPDTYTKSASYRMRITADGLRMIQRVHYKNDRDGKESDRDFTELQMAPVNVLGEEDGTEPTGLAFITGIDDNDYTAGNQPASFLALGNGKNTTNNRTMHNLDVIYSSTAKSGYPAGLNVHSHFHILPPGADHSIQAVWVSWSNWDGGEKYPALVQDGSNWGGIAFPKSGRVTLFDAYGRYYTPDRNTGIGPYNNYGG